MNGVVLKLVLVEKQGNQPEGMTAGDSIDILLRDDRPIIVGRAPDVDALVMAPSVGRKVVRLYVTPEGVELEDLGSAGGSRLEFNGVVTERPSGPLPDNAVLWIGGVAFRVKLLDEQ